MDIDIPCSGGLIFGSCTTNGYTQTIHSLSFVFYLGHSLWIDYTLAPFCVYTLQSNSLGGPILGKFTHEAWILLSPRPLNKPVRRMEYGLLLRFLSNLSRNVGEFTLGAASTLSQVRSTARNIGYLNCNGYYRGALKGSRSFVVEPV